MANYSLVVPQGFDDYAAEVEAKGWFADARLKFDGRKYRITFYDPTRLSQEIESEIQGGRIFFEPNLVVIQSVTRLNMENAIEALIQSDGARLLVAELP